MAWQATHVWRKAVKRHAIIGVYRRLYVVYRSPRCSCFAAPLKNSVKYLHQHNLHLVKQAHFMKPFHDLDPSLLWLFCLPEPDLLIRQGASTDIFLLRATSNIRKPQKSRSRTSLYYESIRPHRSPHQSKPSKQNTVFAMQPSRNKQKLSNDPRVPKYTPNIRI